MAGILMSGLSKITPYFIAYNAGLTASGTIVTVPQPASELALDLLLNICGSKSAVTWTDTGSYSEKIDQGVLPSIRTATKIDGGSEPASVDFTSSASAASMAYLLRFRSATYDAVGTIATTTTNGTLALPSITSAGGLVLAIVVGSATASTCTTPTGFTQIINETTQGQRIGVFSKVMPSGATGAVNTTIASISGTVGGLLMGLK